MRQHLSSFFRGRRHKVPERKALNRIGGPQSKPRQSCSLIGDQVIAAGAFPLAIDLKRSDSRIQSSRKNSYRAFSPGFSIFPFQAPAIEWHFRHSCDCLLFLMGARHLRCTRRLDSNVSSRYWFQLLSVRGQASVFRLIEMQISAFMMGRDPTRPDPGRLLVKSFPMLIPVEIDQKKKTH